MTPEEQAQRDALDRIAQQRRDEERRVRRLERDLGVDANEEDAAYDEDMRLRRLGY